MLATMKRFMLVSMLSLLPLAVSAADYVIDTEGQHAAIQFRIQHLGYSWLYGRFDDFKGHFTFDKENPTDAEVEVEIDVASINTNHAERDKHLRGEDFFHVEKYPKAKFVSTEMIRTGEKTGTMKGDLTLKGVTKPVSIDVEFVGGGEDPWGGFRVGFYGETEIRLKDFNIDYDLGPASEVAQVMLSVEGIRQ